MNRSRLFLLVFVFMITFAMAAVAFRGVSPASSPTGSVTPAAPMLEPRSGQTRDSTA